MGSHIHGVNRFNGKVEARWRVSHYSNDILQVLTMRTRGKVTGTGRIITVEQFVERLFQPPNT